MTTLDHLRAVLEWVLCGSSCGACDAGEHGQHQDGCPIPAAQAHVLNPWQPMETAPITGFVLLRVDYGQDDVVVEMARRTWPIGGEKPGPWVCEGNTIDADCITGWMPLPEVGP